MNNFELESAIKNILLHYLKESDVLDVIRKNLSNSGEICVGEENQIQQFVCLSEKNTSTNSQVDEKLDLILDIQKEIKDLISAKICTETKHEEEYKKNIQKYEEENKNLSDQIKNIEEKCNQELEKYSIFKESLEVWNYIDSLNDENRKYIESLCSGSDVLATLSLGRDDGKIEQLWYYIRDLAIKGDKEKKEVLKLNRYFEFCLKVANSTKVENEKYIILNDELDSEFNVETCIRTSDSKQIGTIKDIFVRSVKLGKNVKFKAIVRVE